METETFIIPENYSELLQRYKGQKKELNDVKQRLYDTSRQLKVNEALLTEYQSDIELLQNREQLQNQKFEAKIAGLEEAIANLRSTHSENNSYLEAELEKKEKENDELKSQIEILKKKTLLETVIDDSDNLNEIIALTNKNELLHKKVQDMEEAFEHLESRNSKLEETLEEYKEELSQVKENLKLKREELSENATLIEKLNDELICANRELENHKHKPLEADSKGNSLFAEVDDRRVHLQETINHMKSGYIRLKQEHGQHVKLISQLRKENTDLRESWKKDLEEIQEDKFRVNDKLKRHVKVLEGLLEDQNKKLEDQSVIGGSDIPKDFKFYHQMITDKCNEIEQWKKKYSNKSINEHLMSINLAEANKKVRLLRLELQQQEEELKEAKAHIETQEAEKPEVVCHKCKTKEDQRKSKRFEIDENHKFCSSQDRVSIKSCLKQQKQTPEDDLTVIISNSGEIQQDGFNIFNNIAPYSVIHRRKAQPLDDSSNITIDPIENVETNISPNTTENLISFGDKENIDSGIETTSAQKKKGVTFSQNTVNPVGNPARKRGTRVFIVHKKADADSTS